VKIVDIRATTVTVPLAAKAKSAWPIASQVSPSTTWMGARPIRSRKKAAPVVADAGRRKVDA